MGKRIDLTGRRFNRLFVLSYKGYYPNTRNSCYECLCDCRNVILVRGNQLASGKTSSCGCLQKDMARESLRKIATTHGLHNGNPPLLYKKWRSMKSRCYYKRDINYKNYGDRGIKVCDSWNADFKQFFEWAVNAGYIDGLTLDRIDVNGNYEPSNCRWITSKEQHRNRRDNLYVEYQGRKRLLIEIAEEHSIPIATLRYRIKNGMPIELAIHTPLDENKSRAGKSNKKKRQYE